MNLFDDAFSFDWLVEGVLALAHIESLDERQMLFDGLVETCADISCEHPWNMRPREDWVQYSKASFLRMVMDRAGGIVPAYIEQLSGFTKHQALTYLMSFRPISKIDPRLSLMDACVSGEADTLMFTDYLYYWYNKKTNRSLPQFLGMDEEEYAFLIDQPEYVLKDFVRGKKLGKPISVEYYKENVLYLQNAIEERKRIILQSPNMVTQIVLRRLADIGTLLMTKNTVTGWDEDLLCMYFVSGYLDTALQYRLDGKKIKEMPRTGRATLPLSRYTDSFLQVSCFVGDDAGLYDLHMRPLRYGDSISIRDEHEYVGFSYMIWRDNIGAQLPQDVLLLGNAQYQQQYSEKLFHAFIRMHKPITMCCSSVLEYINDKR